MTEPSPLPTPSGAAPAGWYPAEHGVMRWWDGGQWAAPAPAPGTQMSAGNQRTLILTVGLIAAVLGLFLSLQPVSLMTGSGKVWTGAAIAIGAFVLVVVMLRKTTKWAVIVIGIIAALSVASAVATEIALQDKRDELNQMFE
jgi:hypothetical protein